VPELKLDGALHILVPRVWLKPLRRIALDRDLSASELVRQAVAEKYELPYETTDESDE
jgi:hypothetical protein